MAAVLVGRLRLAIVEDRRRTEAVELVHLQQKQAARISFSSPAASDPGMSACMRVCRQACRMRACVGELGCVELRLVYVTTDVGLARAAVKRKRGPSLSVLQCACLRPRCLLLQRAHRLSRLAEPEAPQRPEERLIN